MTLNVDDRYTTPELYIKNQLIERQEVLTLLRHAILEHLPTGFKETMQYNMITYVIPHEIYPQGYHCNPQDGIPFISLANQKNYIALYHMGIVANEELRTYFVAEYSQLNIGKLDMGKSCIRFKNMKKIPFKLIEDICSKMTPADFLNSYEKYIAKK